MPAATGSASRRRSRSSPMSNSRRASSPMTKKKKVIRPLLIQSRRSWEMPWSPTCTDRVVLHRSSYDEASTFTHTRAATVAARRMAALPVWVRRKVRRGVCRLRAQAVRPVNRSTAIGASSPTGRARAGPSRLNSAAAARASSRARRRTCSGYHLVNRNAAASATNGITQ